eukprot:m.650476 g.650476  ORF g.650476 m.650476 type:complete len:206 (-) comp58395_c0_seq26:1508-2125(-)
MSAMLALINEVGHSATQPKDAQPVPAGLPVSFKRQNSFEVHPAQSPSPSPSAMSWSGQSEKSEHPEPVWHLGKALLDGMEVVNEFILVPARSPKSAHTPATSAAATPAHECAAAQHLQLSAEASALMTASWAVRSIQPPISSDRHKPTSPTRLRATESVCLRASQAQKRGLTALSPRTSEMRRSQSTGDVRDSAYSPLNRRVTEV